MAVFKVALVQKKAVPNNPEENQKSMVHWIEEAKARGADLVLFPEMWSNGYAPPFPGAFDNPLHPDFEAERKQWFSQAVTLESPYIHAAREAAARCQIGVCATFLGFSEGKYQNRAILIDRQGRILLDYAKVHTCDFSLEALLTPGEGFSTAEFDGITLGVMICYDREFPESARVLMLQGAELILVPNACDMNPARLQQLSTRAFENMVGVAMANYPGSGWGQSCAYSPVVFDGEGKYADNLLLKAEDTSQDIYIVQFDMEKIREYRRTETWGNAYRKPGAYQMLLSPQVREPFIREPLMKRGKENEIPKD